MRVTRGRMWVGALLLLLLSLGALASALPGLVDARMNTLIKPPPYPASASARSLHGGLFVADLHDDALLWNRDLLQRYDRGHSDLPRLLDGGLALQVFSVVTKTPKGINYERNRADSDNVTLLAMAQRWPRATWGSLLARAQYQSDKLHQAALDSQGRLVVVKNQGDLGGFVQGWNQDHHRVAAVLALEGMHALEGRLDNVDRLYDAGFRVAGLTHFFDNELGGSAHGVTKGGITPFGRQVVAKLEAKGMLVDLAHASRPLIDDVLRIAQRPVLVSHTGVVGTCPGPRNLTDDHLRRVAATGGVVGIGYWDGAVCDASVPGIVKAIRYAVDKVGVAHVALGSDFNGATRMPFDVTGVPQLTQGLMQAGFSTEDIRAIMGGNIQRLLLQSLPRA